MFREKYDPLLFDPKEIKYMWQPDDFTGSIELMKTFVRNLCN